MMSSSALSFTLFAHGGGFGINTNLLETNLINLIIVIGVLIWFLRGFLGEFSPAGARPSWPNSTMLSNVWPRPPRL